MFNLNEIELTTLMEDRLGLKAQCRIVSSNEFKFVVHGVEKFCANITWNSLFPPRMIWHVDFSVSSEHYRGYYRLKKSVKTLSYSIYFHTLEEVAAFIKMMCEFYKLEYNSRNDYIWRAPLSDSPIARSVQLGLEVERFNVGQGEMAKLGHSNLIARQIHSNRKWWLVKNA